MADAPPDTAQLESPASPPEFAYQTHDPNHPKPYAIHLRLAIGPWTVYFRSPFDKPYVNHETMEMLDSTVVRKTLQRTRQDAQVRLEIGTDKQVWQEMGELIDSAIPSIEQRCFKVEHPQDSNVALPPDHEYDPLSGTLIALNADTLCLDLDRLNNMVAITRNVLVVGELAQEMVSETRFDRDIFRLISLCVKVTARGFDGEPGNDAEERWQGVVNAFKKVLITCLQFLNNLVTRNERRKLMLWIQLFDSTTPSDAVVESYQAEEGDGTFDVQYEEEEPFEMKLISGVSQSIFVPPCRPTEKKPETNNVHKNHGPVSSPFLYYIGRNGYEIKRQLEKEGKAGGAAEIAAECRRRWELMSPEDRANFENFYKDYRIESPHVNTTAGLTAKGLPPAPSSKKISTGHPPLDEKVEALIRSINGLRAEADDLVKDHDDIRMRKLEAVFAADVLQRGKDDLMKRLEPEKGQPVSAQLVSPTSSVVSPSSPHPPLVEPPPPLEEASEEDDSEDDEYPVPGDDGRGLLTDVPLILGPTEIEVLPMIIMSGVVAVDEVTSATPEETRAAVDVRNLHTLRCYLLLAQDNGRNLLRELLIFVAAWDLREEELYFKFMVKIMDSILKNGLMPFSYQSFREIKDIISPAQAVIMKLLTNIFRTKQSREQIRAQDYPEDPPEFPMQVDVDMVKYLFTEFRSNIIPQACALIFLQGKIRQHQASPEDFPLNLWDMERMYEGIYQYLEFFAVLTEHDLWKKMMTDWDLICELVTILRELDTAIPQMTLSMMSRAADSTAEQVRRSTAAAAAMTYDPRNPTMPSNQTIVERPWDPKVGEPQVRTDTPPPPPPPATNPMPPARFIAEVGGFGNESPAEEPSDFEWRNLKKLAVLVLSSLVWRSRTVQDQVRNHNGIEAVLNCCKHDEHNPYIREHAIMCLRFLLEGNAENQAVIRELEPRGVVPSEVLDEQGYESFMDARGQVGLRRKERREPVPKKEKAPPPPPVALPQALRDGMAKLESLSFGPNRDPEELARLMQTMMRELPARMQATRTDAEAAALGKLNKRFEDSG